MVYANDTTISADTWSFVGVGSILSSLYVASADTTDLVITNFTGASVTFKYFIFYDNQVGSSGVVINQSEQVVKVTKDGFNTLTETDPNNYIFHSDLNTFKIVYQGKTTITVTVAPQNSQFAHNSPLADTTCILMFAQFPDGKVTPVSWYGSQANSTKAYSNLQGLNGRAFDGAYYDDTNIYVPNTGGTAIAYDVVFVWYIFEAAI